MLEFNFTHTRPFSGPPNDSSSSHIEVLKPKFGHWLLQKGFKSRLNGVSMPKTSFDTPASK